MDRSVKEKFQEIDRHPFNNEEAEYQQSEAVQQGQPERKRGRKKKDNKLSMKSVNFTLSLDLIERLGHYRVHRTRTEGRSVTNSEVAEKALDEFLTKEGY